MEKFIAKHNSAVYDFKVGKEYKVLRDLCGNCVLIHDNPRIRKIIFSEDKLKSYGILIGKRRFCLF